MLDWGLRDDDRKVNVRKPRLFIASSVESLPVAEAINANLDHELEVTLWKSGTFRLSSSTIEDLVRKSSAVDYALFVFTPDDVAVIRDKREHVVRDNVLFELGLFIGAIGRERCFIVRPRGVDLHLPTDLLGGMTPADYESSRSDGDLMSAVNRACTLVKAEIKQKGVIGDLGDFASRRVVANPDTYRLTIDDLSILSWAAESHTSNPEGLRYDWLQNRIPRMHDSIRKLGIIKLEKLGYVERRVERDKNDDYDFFAYRITENGITALLNNDAAMRAALLPSNAHHGPDDDIPF
jgi:hypothetical protein